MKNILRYALVTLFGLFLVTEYSFADKVPVPEGKAKAAKLKSTAAGCLPGAGFKYLDINNVRTRINTGGDMWWNFEDADYEIPKKSGKMSMFSASLWIGGIDVNDQLKLAAIRYRQGPDFGGGNDYWPGPLTVDGTASITEDICTQYDRLFPITRAEIDQFLAWWDAKSDYPDYSIPTSIIDWPAHGDVSRNQSYYLAPFYDRDGDGNYDPYSGDYPYYDVGNVLCKSSLPPMEGIGILADQVIKGDQTLWWVFNDKGNIHTETEGDPIGMEIRGQAFGFTTNDEINNMTFYSYEIINRSTFVLRDTYFSQWVDTDLGYAKDDYVGCDVDRGLGYCYNGTSVDGSGQAWAYGSQPPAIGVDFFQGPYMDPDGKDNPAFEGNCALVTSPDTLDQMALNGVNFGDGIVDNERFGMRRFVYHNNSGVAEYMTDPDYAPQYYNFLRGIWKDGTKMTYGGNAHISSGAYGPDCDFMFPGDSDPCFWGTKGNPPNGDVYWTEVTAGNNPYDRRFMQSAGPFKLEPGAVNYITVGIPWARAASGGPEASVALLRVTDDKCQSLFDNCFQVVNGPNAPDLTIRELDQTLIFYITNRRSNDAGNNFNESYKEIDPNIKSPDDLHGADRYDSTYNFEGYQVFQLANSSVSVADLKNPDLARPVFQCDVRNGIGQLVNYYYDQALGGNVPVEEVNGADLGISHTFVLTKDAFSGDRFVNHKQYYFLALAYGFNQYMIYSQDPGAQQPPIIGLDGQKEPYLAGRKNIKVYTGIPHKTVGTISTQADYGDIPRITRLAGQGNGGNVLELTQESIDKILAQPPLDWADSTSGNIYGTKTYPINYQPEYETNAGPILVRIIDPLNVKSGTYRVEFDSLYYMKVYDITGDPNTTGDTTSTYIAKWRLVDVVNNKTYISDTNISYNNEQLFLDLGFSITIHQKYPPGTFKVGQDPDQNDVYAVLEANSGLQGSTIIYADSSRRWLSGVPDDDNPWAQNWIRSGEFTDPDNAAYNDWNLYVGIDGTPEGRAFDPDANYETVLSGTWAPYGLCASNSQNLAGPAFGGGKVSNQSKLTMNIYDVASVDIVLTADKSKWTRSPVIEMCPDPKLAEGGAVQFDTRSGRSVDKDGKPTPAGVTEASDNPDDPNYISATGMGWFPGYAINIETGERLNIAFSEDSWLVKENGRDMLWNPTSTVWDFTDPLNTRAIFGGKHYVYVFAHTYNKYAESGTYLRQFDMPAYDAGKRIREEIPINYNQVGKAIIYSSCMWVGIPLAVDGEPWFSNDAKIKIRITKPYSQYFSTPLADTVYYPDSSYFIPDPDITYNNFYPAYEFNTEGFATVTDNVEKAKTDLDLINIVPNPYYGYSPYETNQLDNRVKITNLPQRCSISIYTMSGTLIRQFTKDDSKTSVDWDLKNYAGIPVASGIYLVYVKADGVGERILKWFGSLRPVDLNAF
ncbi:MAG: T9SS type A sorting domain-containing protein [Bacteroidales bacterium]|nr:T9SS type A sorting domain-containing protein [Bacteroidales bacterium]